VFYIVIEVQIDKAGNYGVLYTVYENEAQAKSAWHTVCAAADVSDIPYHSAYILRSDGIITYGETNERRTEVAE